MTRSTAIILAAGKGTRMGGSVRKQYMELQGRPLLSYCLETFSKSEIITDIVIAVPEGEEEYVMEHVIRDVPDSMEKLRRIVPGGAERYDSVLAGLKALRWPCDYVFIHDGARPFIDEDSIRRLYETARREGTGVAGMPSKDTVKIADAHHFVKSTPDRKGVWMVQTPQVFSYDLILEAYTNLPARMKELEKKGISVTDDAMVVEYMTGHPVKMVEASYRNIKVTTPEDLMIAQAFCRE